MIKKKSMKKTNELKRRNNDEEKQKRRNKRRSGEIRVKREKKIVGGWCRIHISDFKASSRAQTA
ncbi:hypothetical protein MTR67_052713 [Solanum verrucosum]|uniref:Uncharacterized protein n=1 Tax=Solanum verrucosum TaxID=315347 RepID=A0AAF1A333_SOLVR|nr:hypothetical protein MTR67_052713 [Solanum verrucosum]